LDDKGGKLVTRALAMTVDEEAPKIRLDGPARVVTARPSFDLAGEVKDAHLEDAVAVNGTTFSLGADGRFSAPRRPLDPGENLFRVTARDLAGNASEALVTVILDRE